mgnify:FL=1
MFTIFSCSHASFSITLCCMLLPLFWVLHKSRKKDRKKDRKKPNIINCVELNWFTNFFPFFFDISPSSESQVNQFIFFGSHFFQTFRSFLLKFQKQDCTVSSMHHHDYYNCGVYIVHTHIWI